MKRYEKRVEQVERSVLVEMSCDLCGRKAEPGNPQRCNGPWPVDKPAGGAAEVTVEMRAAWSGAYADVGGFGEVVSFDLCPDCFGRMREWLEAQGARPHAYDYDF